MIFAQGEIWSYYRYGWIFIPTNHKIYQQAVKIFSLDTFKLETPIAFLPDLRLIILNINDKVEKNRFGEEIVNKEWLIKRFCEIRDYWESSTIKGKLIIPRDHELPGFKTRLYEIFTSDNVIFIANTPRKPRRKSYFKRTMERILTYKK